MRAFLFPYKYAMIFPIGENWYPFCKQISFSNSSLDKDLENKCELFVKFHRNDVLK